MMIRGVLVVSQLIWVVALSEQLPMFLFMLLNISLLMFQGFSFRHVVKSLRLLLWLFIPIFVFQGLFMPGTYIIFPLYLPFTIEGLERGLDLSLHIAVVFFAALLVMRLFLKQEWLYLLNNSPFYHNVAVDIHLLLTLKQRVPDILSQQKKEWLEHHHRWKILPNVLSETIIKVLIEGKHEAAYLWEHWDKRMQQEISYKLVWWSGKDMLFLLALVLGWYLLWMT